MKKDIHPSNYRFVVFRDMSNNTMFLSRSTAASKETVKWEDGNEYPVIKWKSQILLIRFIPVKICW